jgi:hypothetical protein
MSSFVSKARLEACRIHLAQKKKYLIDPENRTGAKCGKPNATTLGKKNSHSK